MEIGKGKVIEPLKTEEPLRILARPDNMVQIPLSEYKRYIEDTIKGPTVEIPLSVVLCQDLVQVKMRNFSPF